MANQERPLVDKKKALFAAKAILLVGGATSAIFGGQRAIAEYGNDKEDRGAITRSLELDPQMGRPSPTELESASAYVRELVGGVDENSDAKELYAVAGNIIVNDSELERHYGTLSHEANFQAARDIFIEEAGANNLDDANLWTLAAGATAAGAVILYEWERKNPKKRNRTAPQLD